MGYQFNCSKTKEGWFISDNRDNINVYIC